MVMEQEISYLKYAQCLNRVGMLLEKEIAHCADPWNCGVNICSFKKNKQKKKHLYCVAHFVCAFFLFVSIFLYFHFFYFSFTISFITGCLYHKMVHFYFGFVDLFLEKMFKPKAKVELPQLLPCPGACGPARTSYPTPPCNQPSFSSLSSFKEHFPCFLLM